MWAANSLHHMGDPARAVAQIYQLLRPGGLLAVTELESFPRFFTDPAGAALEERIHAAMARGRDQAGLHMHEDWPARFAEAGFAVESERRFVIALQPPPDSPMAASVTRYAMVTLCRARHGLEDKLSAGEIAELDALAPALSARDDLTVRTSRTVWLARKPGGESGRRKLITCAWPSADARDGRDVGGSLIVSGGTCLIGYIPVLLRDVQFKVSRHGREMADVVVSDHQHAPAARGSTIGRESLRRRGLRY